MTFIEGVSSRQEWPLYRVCPHVRGGLYRGCVLTSRVAFIEGRPHVRSGLYRGVSSRQE